MFERKKQAARFIPAHRSDQAVTVSGTAEFSEQELGCAGPEHP